jgi:hypothetical protein
MWRTLQRAALALVPTPAAVEMTGEAVSSKSHLKARPRENSAALWLSPVIGACSLAPDPLAANPLPRLADPKLSSSVRFFPPALALESEMFNRRTPPRAISNAKECPPYV